MIPDRQPWTEQALCAQTDPDTFFPEKGSPTAVRNAKTICALCPCTNIGGVNVCLEYALANNERFGVWGGYSERQRRTEERRRRAATNIYQIPA